MRFASLGSGSKGNATLVEAGQTCLMLDCGFTLKEAEARLQRLDKSGHDLDAIVVTHEHSDHLKGVGALARKYKLPVYLTAGTYRDARLGNLPRVEWVNCHQSFSIKDIDVQPVPVPHDAREPCQYVFTHAERRLGVLTDLGSLTPHIQMHYDDLDALVLEFNHDLQMLEEGPYPYQLKQRISGDYGHLSNLQAAQLLARIKRDKLQHLVLSHISQQNNSHERVCSAVSEWLQGMACCADEGFAIACQENGFDWRVIS
ncbi:MAG: MBL fold metallo-hydrolase [Pseudomonadales bacterium]